MAKDSDGTLHFELINIISTFYTTPLFYNNYFLCLLLFGDWGGLASL